MKRIRILGLVAVVCLLALTVGLMVRSQDTKASGIKGTIDTVSDNTMVVDGKTVIINEATHIEGTPTAGAVVEIKAIVQEDGSLLAIKMEVKGTANRDCDDDCCEDDKYVELEGVADNVTSTSVVVHGKTVTVDGNTTVKGTLVDGVKVEVKAIVQDDGSLLAVKIEAEAEADDDEGDCEDSGQACRDDCKDSSQACQDDCKDADQGNRGSSGDVEDDD
jgi:hypothetical protein